MNSVYLARFHWPVIFMYYITPPPNAGIVYTIIIYSYYGYIVDQTGWHEAIILVQFLKSA